MLSGRLKSAQRVALQGSGKRREVGGQEREADYLSEEFVAGEMALCGFEHGRDGSAVA